LLNERIGVGLLGNWLKLKVKRHHFWNLWYIHLGEWNWVTCFPNYLVDSRFESTNVSIDDVVGINLYKKLNGRLYFYSIAKGYLGLYISVFRRGQNG